jgi:hypothetical protein
MKKLILTFCLVFGLLIAPMAMADTVQLIGGVGYRPYQTGSGGEFTFSPSAGLNWILNAGYIDTVTKNVLGLTGTFQTFCVEKGEFVHRTQDIKEGFRLNSTGNDYQVKSCIMAEIRQATTTGSYTYLFHLTLNLRR